MKIIRFTAGGMTKWGVIEGNTVFGHGGSPFAAMQGRAGGFTPDRSSYKVSDVKLLAPCQPSKIVAVGLNYHAHAQEFKQLKLPSEPLIFLKPSTAVIGPDDTIVIPGGSEGRVDYECELAVVIGKEAKNVPEEQAKEYIIGYTCANDVTERTYQKEDGQWTRAKGFDTFAPLGPWIATNLSPDDLRIETVLNGEVKQSSRTSSLIFGVYKLVSFISRIMTLLPGDVISTGTPGGIGRMNPGDVVEIKIEGIGTLKNQVASATNS